MRVVKGRKIYRGKKINEYTSYIVTTMMNLFTMRISKVCEYKKKYM